SETFDAWKGREAPEACVIHLADLHEWPAALLPLLQIEVHRAARRGRPLFFLAEFDSDLLQNPLKTVAFDEIRLADFSAAQTRDLIRAATADLDRPVPEAVAQDIASGSGGRPLLALEQLRSYLVDPGRPFHASKDMAQAAAVRVEEIPPASRALFARLVTHPEPAETADLGVTSPAGPEWDLQERGLATAKAGRLALTHPALREAYAAALETSERTEAHRAWLRILLKQYGDKPVIAAEAALITHHALGCGEDSVAYAWGLEAMDYHAGRGNAARALRLSDELLRRAKDDVQTYTLEAYRAPLFYRLGRFQDALASYDRWYALKPDDGTGVETVKHLLFTGQTLSAWGRPDEARARLNSCLEAGDGLRHVRHRPYHARAHIALATLDEKSHQEERAKEHLQAAIPLAEGQPLLLAEIEQKLGQRAHAENRLDEAVRHLERSRTECREAGNPQVEAITVNVMAMIDRERGRLKMALETIGEAIALAEKGGEILQIARYRQNRALIRMNLALYGPALEEMEDVQDVFEALGEDQDRRQARLHREELSRLLGETERTEKDPPFSSEEGRRIAQALAAWNGREPSESDLAGLLEAVEGLEAPEERIGLLEAASNDVSRRGWEGLAQLFRHAAGAELKKIHDNLPEELQMDFENKRDVKTLDAALSGLFKAKADPGRSIPDARFRQFCEINRKIALQNDLKRILDEVIDAAIQISGAERGFVLLKNPKSKAAPLPGFEVKAARNLNQKAIEAGDFELSLSLVKQALDRGTHVLTDDALADPRFQEKKSVMDYRLRSVLVLPLEQEGSVFGVIYLDHRYQPDRFSEEDLSLLLALASQASIAVQKARMIEELTASRDRLAGQVKEQEVKIEHLSEALTQKRENLRYGYEEIIGRSPPMMTVFKLLDNVTETTIPVWIHGESGTGKELIARSLHFNSPRKNGPFVAENVSAIPETLLESELFGHKKGSFTHADRDRVGLFEQASGGTLFLDEVADMSLAMQAKLLRVLQEGEVRPVGSSKTVKINVRLVTASNKDLRRLVSEGKFRQDLFFRINGLTIDLPPLRTRKDDIPLLARHILKKVSKEFNLPASELSDKATQILMKHDWPGNVRELEAALRNALLFAKGRPIAAEHLNLQPRPVGSYGSSSPAPREAPATEEDMAHRQLVVETLRRHQLNKEEAAKDLKVSLRTLYTWMEKHGIPKKKAMLARYVG
ncbi:MAG TPA: sigma 54-interacting transcriptional regulator, partial [bacterium]|nr:sigma 54-interacting transcriptional regulator [bacterium]